MTFENLNLIQPLLNAVNKKGYLNPTPIQEKSDTHHPPGKRYFWMRTNRHRQNRCFRATDPPIA